MRKQKYSLSKSAQQGVVLIEAMIAILIFSFGVLGIVGLQAAMVKNTSESKYRADASNLAQEQIGLLWTRPNLLTDPITCTPNPVSFLVLGATFRDDILPNGKISILQPVPCINQYTVTITWQAPGEPQHSYTAFAIIEGAK